MELKVIVGEDGFAPVRSNPTDAGADLVAPHDVFIPANSYTFVSLGIKIKLPEGTVGYIFARSGLGCLRGVRPRNCVGVIDEKYHDDIGIMLENHSDSEITLKKGERLAQLVVSPVLTPTIVAVDSFDTTGDRGGGFGSTGK